MFPRERAVLVGLAEEVQPVVALDKEAWLREWGVDFSVNARGGVAGRDRDPLAALQHRQVRGVDRRGLVAEQRAPFEDVGTARVARGQRLVGARRQGGKEALWKTYGIALGGNGLVKGN